MKTCPRCGHDNPDMATLCEHCQEALPAPDSAVETTAQPPTEEPPEAPPEGSPVWPGVPTWPGPAQESRPSSRTSGWPQEPGPLPPPAFWTKKRQYLLGLGLGLVPVVLLLAGVGNLACAGGGRVIAAAGYLYAAQIVGGLVAVCFDRIRSVGYGLLTMTLAGPIVAAIGCAVILSQNPTVQPPPPPPLPATFAVAKATSFQPLFILSLALARR
jgi:hypothetical protein